MKRVSSLLLSSFCFALCIFLAFSASAQVDVGDYTVSGSMEVDGLPRSFSGDKSRYEEYRSLPETLVVPQIQLMIGGKKEDIYLNFDSYKTGLRDQNYSMRFGRYGLIDVELGWDQIPHNFDDGHARTPYLMNGGTYTLLSRTPGVSAAQFSNWINTTAQPVNLDLLEKIGKISIRYTPTAGWSFTGKYWNQNSDGRRAFGIINGNSPTNGNISELAEPIDYQTHNIELGGEYAGNNWSVGLKYNGSLFHNSTSTLVWDNPLRAGPGPCVDQLTTSPTLGTGPCRGQLDLYPSNQAHTFTLTGAASLPWKTQFLGTASYGWRLQNDAFLPTTNNACYTGGPCLDALQTMPLLTRNSLNGDVRPTMINLGFTNNFVDHLNLKAFYRFYDLDNQTKTVQDPQGIVLNDQGTPDLSRWGTAPTYQYSKNTMGFQAGYDFTKWLNGKFNYSWEKIHRSLTVRDRTSNTVFNDQGEFFNNSEIKVGPTFDLKPNSWLLFRAAYQYSSREAPGYHEERTMFFVARRNQNKISLFTDVSPWETLSFHGGFDVASDTYPKADLGNQYAQSYSPSVGALYTPLEWLKLFADYNYDWSGWRQNYSTTLTTRGRDKANTFSLGSDMDLIKSILTFRVQYSFSQGFSEISNNPTTGNYPPNANTWQELLARLEYQLHKNVALQVGYYFNRFRSKDYGVDIMQPWMGNFDTAAGQIRSIYLGDQFKGSYTAHTALLGVKFKF